MVLHCREFTLDSGDTVLMGHDRESGARYLCIEATREFLDNPRDAVTVLSRAEWDAVASIFWID